jgi:hypothetical protein
MVVQSAKFLLVLSFSLPLLLLIVFVISFNGPDSAGFDTCGDVLCHNGGTCMTSIIYNGNGDEETRKHYDCSTAVTEDTAFAGESCKFEATVFCTKPKEGGGLDVNDRECRDNGKPTEET